jgi:hypothetical protein
MHEILAKPGYDALPLAKRTFFELSIEESDLFWRPGSVVKQYRAEWSEIDRQFMWDSSDFTRCSTLIAAEVEFRSRLNTLRAQGFSQTVRHSQFCSDLRS